MFSLVADAFAYRERHQGVVVYDQGPMARLDFLATIDGWAGPATAISGDCRAVTALLAAKATPQEASEYRQWGRFRWPKGSAMQLARAVSLGLAVSGSAMPRSS
jgi:hypothetical protein